MDIEENDLERALRLAATDADSRPAFLELLLRSSVYVLVPHKVRAMLEKNKNPSAEKDIDLITWQKSDGAVVLPVFSSLEVLKSSIEGDAAHIALPVRHLFVMTRGATLVLNPRSKYGKEFPPDEIEAIIKKGTMH